MSDEQKTPIYALSTIIVGLLTYLGVVVNSNNSEILEANKAKQVLQSKIDDLKQQNFNLKNQIFVLEFESTQTIDELNVIEDFLDQMPMPTYIKVFEPDNTTKVIFINEAYERRYNISKELYEGSTDFEIWPDHMAEKMLAMDRDILRRKNVFKHVEKAEILGEKVTVTSWKFYVKLENKKHGVGGVIIDEKFED